jgi:hypothetical protein
LKFHPELLVAAFLFASVSLTAQNFESAVGARLGFPFSASYKLFVNESDAVEAYTGYYRSAFATARLSGRRWCGKNRFADRQGVGLVDASAVGQAA